MKNNFSVSILKGLNKDGLPLLRINLLRSLCFNVLIDTSSRYNLIDPSFIYFEVDEDFYTCFEEYPSNIRKPKMYMFKDFFDKLGTHEITGKDGVKKIVDKLNFSFEFKGEKYSEIVSVVDLYHDYNTRYHIKKGYIDIVLGADFLVKHNWIIDYKKKVIYSPINS
jgi:hypothetical protein